jgi:hypothetical protein
MFSVIFLMQLLWVMKKLPFHGLWMRHVLHKIWTCQDPNFLPLQTVTIPLVYAL